MHPCLLWDLSEHQRHGYNARALAHRIFECLSCHLRDWEKQWSASLGLNPDLRFALSFLCPMFRTFPFPWEKGLQPQDAEGGRLVILR
jgi:hypothetical protein